MQITQNIRAVYHYTITITKNDSKNASRPITTAIKKAYLMTVVCFLS